MPSRPSTQASSTRSYGRSGSVALGLVAGGASDAGLHQLEFARRLLLNRYNEARNSRRVADAHRTGLFGAWTGYFVDYAAFDQGGCAETESAGHRVRFMHDGESEGASQQVAFRCRED